ncbi:MAG: GTPase ObgE [Candidatus Dormiibacterota bacterium]
MPPISPRLVDSASVELRAGAGGRGAVSFRREPFIPRGGPDGGDGGDGGSIVLRASPELDSLADLSHRRLWRAESGHPGGGSRRSGKSGADLLIAVPVGTLVVDDETGDVLGDLGTPGAELLAARGGAGGRGNVHFKSSVNRSPQTAEPGLPGEAVHARLELKLIADVGLVGAPNAGKSSLLRAISAATPRVGAYPFTTLEPELGVVELPSGRRVVVADIPGLIEGAAEGAGLGRRFLRHVERTRLLVYVVDGAAPDPWGDLATVRAEVAGYATALAERPSLTIVNKVDLPEVQKRILGEPPEKAAFPGGDGTALLISAQRGDGIPRLLTALENAFVALPEPAPTPVTPRRVRLRRAASPPKVVRHAWGYEVSGAGVERLVQRTDFDAEPALQRFQVILDRTGVSAALQDAGAEPGDTVRVGDLEFEYQP